MKNMEFESIAEASGNFLIYNTENNVQFDRIAVRMLSSDLPYFLIPAKTMTKYDKKIVKYDIGSLRGISEIKMRMSKKECCTLISNMLRPLTRCSEWLLDYHHLLFKKENIFYSGEGYEIKYIYILDNDFECSDSEISDLFKDIFRKAEIMDDKMFQIDLLQYLLDSSFTLKGFEDMINQEMRSGRSAASESPVKQSYVQSAARRAYEEPASAAVRQDSAPEETAPPVLSAKAEEQLFGAPEGAEDIPDIFADKPGKKAKAPKKSAGGDNEKKSSSKKGILGFLGKKKASAAEVSEDNDFTVLEGAYEGDEKTEFVSAQLVLSSADFADCPKVIPVVMGPQGKFTMGRKRSGPSEVDFEFPSECSKISRSHCCITKDGSDYMISDLNSSNGTYVDGQRLEPGKWVILSDGASVMLGSNTVVFTFQIMM